MFIIHQAVQDWLFTSFTGKDHHWHEDHFEQPIQWQITKMLSTIEFADTIYRRYHLHS